MHLERAGVKTGKGGAILVDETLKTSAPHIWAAGDVLGEPQLEPAARAGGEIAAMNALSGQARPFDRSALPSGIFTSPQVAGVGMTEEQARRAGLSPESRCVRMEVMSRTALTGDTRGMVKIVADGKGGRVLGVHICASIATEMIQEGVLAVKHRLTVSDLAETLHVYPTATEVLQVCARAFRRESDGCPGSP
jgi:mercuric reductase